MNEHSISVIAKLSNCKVDYPGKRDRRLKVSYKLLYSESDENVVTSDESIVTTVTDENEAVTEAVTARSRSTSASDDPVTAVTAVTATEAQMTLQDHKEVEERPQCPVCHRKNKVHRSRAAPDTFVCTECNHIF